MTMTATGLDERLRALIEAALATPYTSRSGFDGTATGNHYQSIALGGEATRGFRGDRGAVLDCVDFRGRKVLDLGSNLGEVSRAARARGARLVDGVEYDPFFVELAQLITAYNGQSRVSFRQGDVTDPATYEERYDVVLALSVFHYVSRVLDRIAAIADVLVVETHRLHGNFDAGYLGPVQERFPAMRVLGRTDWGQLGDPDEMRLVIAFAKDRARLDEVLAAPPAWSEPETAGGDRVAPEERVVDPRASTLHDPFFRAWDYDGRDALLSAIASVEAPVETLAANANVVKHGYSGWVYWFLCLKGWLHYRATGETGEGNPYFEYMTRHYTSTAEDLALGRALADPEVAEARIRSRFEDLDRFYDADADAALAGTPPVRAYVGEPVPPEPLVLADADGGPPVQARLVDGWHRLFGARALDVARLRAEVVHEPRGLPLLRGAIESLALTGDVLSVGGWCLDPSGPLDAIELRLDGETLGLAIPSEREDVAAGHEDLAHARHSGFRLDGEIYPDQPARLEVLGIRDWLPVGRIPLAWEPDMLAAPMPPIELAGRLHGYPDAGRLTMRAALAAGALLDAVEPYRALASFRDVVHWEAGCALLGRLAARRLPGAAPVALVEDEEALAWAREHGAPGELHLLGPQPPSPLADGAADLVLRDRPLAALDADALRAWLGELMRILRPGGYAALVGGWPAGERARMLELCNGWLHVVGAGWAPSWPRGDVVVLRRP